VSSDFINSIESHVLTLTNDGEFYRRIMPYMRRLVNGCNYYSSFRRTIFETMRDRISPGWSSAKRRSTTALTARIFEHYYEEASGGEQISDEAMQHKLVRFMPNWAQLDFAEYKDELIRSRRASHDDQLDAYRFVAAQLSEQQQLREAGIPTPTPIKEQAMTIKITNLTLVNGQDISKLSDDEIFDLIAATEKEIDKLEAIGTKPAKLVKKIDELKTAVRQLADLCDSR